MSNFPDKNDILKAEGRIKPFIHHTPVLTSRNLDQTAGAWLFFKCENLQKTGSFKFRGACNSVFSLSENEAKDGVATHSSGNHAQALALAAKQRGIQAYIVMPRTSAKPKVAAVQNYGGIVSFCKPGLKSREETLNVVLSRTGAHEIHPYNDHRTICGQATAAKELIEDAGEPLDVIIAPVGGGGLISGSALSAHYFSPGTKVIAAEPENANDAYLSFKAGHIIPAPPRPNTIADGLLTSLGNLTFPIIQQHVHEIITVKEDEIIAAMKLIWERMKLVIEPSAAVAFAAILKNKVKFNGKRIGVILCGGNIDLQKIPW
jgi:threonine dehydratase